MVGVVTGFVGMFTDIGLSAATVQRPRVDHAQVSTLFWLNVLLGLAVAAVTAACSPLVAWFFGDPRLTAMTALSACGFIMAGLTVQHIAILQRQMRFHLTTAIGVGNGAVSALVGVTLAWSGWGVWSLVIMGLAGSATSLVLVWLTAGWIPGPPVRRSGVRGMLKFGGWVTGHSFCNYLSRNVDNFLLGWWAGAGPLGIYSRAYGLLMMPVQQISGPIGSVAKAALARTADDVDAYRAEFIACYRLLIGLAAPVAACCFALADEIILLILGEQWAAAGPVFRVLAACSVVQLAASPAGWLFISRGDPRSLFHLGLYQAPILVAAVACGLPFGAVGVAWGFTGGMLAVMVPMIALATRGTPVAWTDFLLPVLPQLGVAATCAIVAVQVHRRIVPAYGELAAMGFAAGLAGGLAAAAAFLDYHRAGIASGGGGARGEATS